MSTLAERIAAAMADPIDVQDDFPWGAPYDGNLVIGIRPADLDELLRLAGIELPD